MFDFFRKLNFIQKYSLFMLFWFIIIRSFALNNTDDIARDFLANPFTLSIAQLTIFYVTIVLVKGKISDYNTITLPEKIFLHDFTYPLCLIHGGFMLYRGYVFFTGHVLVDFCYLILDIYIVMYC